MSITLFIIGILVGLAGLAAVFYGFSEDETGPKVGGFIALLVGVVMFVTSFVTTVDARAIGIQTSGGRYKDTIGSGRHMTAPWSNVEEWSTRNQTLVFDDGKDDDDSDNYENEGRVTVKLANQGEAYISAIVVWNVGGSTVDKTEVTDAQKTAIKGLWAQYKSFGDMKKSFIKPSVQSASSAQFGTYDPLGQIKAVGDGVTEIKTVSNADWSKLMKDDLGKRYSDRGIVLVSVEVTRVDFDKATKDKLDAYNAEIANTRIASQKVETAKQDALASQARATKSAPGCEALIRDLAEKDQLKNLPAGWQCPGTTGPAVVSSNK
jgi:regulator of protease activity HflC (stomatin/prohibitin superfamily)